MTKSGFSTLGASPSQSSGKISDAGADAESSDLTPVISVPKSGPWLQFRRAKGFEWTQAELPIPALPPDLEGIRLLHLSDLHIRSSWDPAYDRLIQRVEQNPPDLILFTGDFIEHKHDFRSALPIIRRLVERLKSRLGFVSILGNHDGDLLKLPLSATGISVLNHQCLRLAAATANLEIFGLVGIDRLDLNAHWLRSIGPKPAQTVRIVMSHFPDVIRSCASLKPDLFLAGHTHGGQICLPGRIPIVRHDSLPRRYWLGIHRLQGTWLVVNRGIGFSTALQLRLFCPAEIIEIRLRRA
jgi:hypothetical protein